LEKASLNHYNYRTYDYDNDVCKIIHRHLQLKENELMKLSEYGRRTLKDNLWIFADKQKEDFLEQQKQRLLVFISINVNLKLNSHLLSLR
jgi:hypothetical protein